ncbi:MAG: lipoate--protein ligase family protein [Bifidobacteriaceae bacterium]|jgi:lipoate-protein ligase A|nr:lipoate--protein ligase family protein [Bifidobacteriaceae bacterium]MCI1915219.1 lipoate--protein ligase family protein [Bifidobacteriaceae bacterium]
MTVKVTVRGSYKQPGGKLVSATVCISGAGAGADTPVIERLSFDGDFYAEWSDGRDADLSAVEAALVGLPVSLSAPQFEEIVAGALPANLTLVGVDAHGMAFAVARAAAQCGEGLGLAGSRAAGESWESTLPDRFPHNSAHPAHQIELTQELIRARWSDLELHIVDPEISAKEPFEPAMHMALDDVIARRTARGDLPPLLRFWEWASPAVILGLNQSLRNEVDVEAARRLGIGVVRRVTGGGAMFVEPGNTITYSLTTPLNFVSGLSAEDSYGLCESWVFDALKAIGISASHEPINDISSPAGKIGGAAQRRYPAHSPAPGGLLHHTTMAYDINVDTMMQVLRVNKEKLVDKPVASAAKRVDPMKSQSGMSRRAILTSFAQFLHANVPHITSMNLPGDVIDEARALAASKFATPEWTARIA